MKTENFVIKVNLKAKKKIEERFIKLFGSISEDQKNLLNGQESYFSQRHEVRVARRELLLTLFTEIFKKETKPDSKAKDFLEAFVHYQYEYPENPKNKEIIKAIIPTLNLEQKEYFEDRTNDLKEILDYYLEANF